MLTLTNTLSYIGHVVQAIALVLGLFGATIGVLVAIAVQTPLACVCVALAALTAAWILFVHNTWAYTVD